MAYGSSSSGGGNGSSTKAYPVAFSFAGLALLALVILAVLRHLFGSVRVDIGTR